jgi:hypothetical protein
LVEAQAVVAYDAQGGVHGLAIFAGHGCHADCRRGRRQIVRGPAGCLVRAGWRGCGPWCRSGSPGGRTGSLHGGILMNFIKLIFNFDL